MTNRHQGQGRVLRSTVVFAAAVASLLTASVALAGTKTVVVNDKDSIPHCRDIDKVRANAGRKTTTFTITMAANVKAAPCRGKNAPNIILNQRCNVSGSPAHASMACEGGGGGAAKISINSADDHQWIVKFATKEAELSGTTSFKFQVSVGTADSAGPATVKIG
ncbi:MAG: hypothetical protein ACJ764_05220 [Solirubrobacteraceae bacterium]